jgi:hypothetical protein
MTDATRPRALEINITHYDTTKGEGISENKARSRSRVAADALFHGLVLVEKAAEDGGLDQVMVRMGSVDGRTGKPMTVAQLFQGWVAFTTHLQGQAVVQEDARTAKFLGMVLSHLQAGESVIVEGGKEEKPTPKLRLVPDPPAES